MKNGFDREKKPGIDGIKFGVQIATKRPWGFPRTPPCALLENLKADINCKHIAKLFYRLQWICRKSIFCGRGIAQGKKMQI